MGLEKIPYKAQILEKTKEIIRKTYKISTVKS